MAPKVLYTASTHSHIVNFHLPYIREFQRLGWEVHVACGGEPMELPPQVRAFFVPFTKEMTSAKNLTCARTLGRLMKEEAYDLVVTHTALAAFFTRLPLLGRRGRPRVINMVHGYLFGAGAPGAKGKLLLAAERLTAPVTDLLLTMNREDHEIALTYRLGREVACIPGVGVDFAPIDRVSGEEAGHLRDSLGVPDDAFLLFYAAEFSRRKNQGLLIRAMTRLPERAVLLLAGQGAELESCRALAQELGVAERVRFPGHLSNPSACYRAADCAISSSHSEGLPFNIMEAMRAGLPVVASDVKGHRDLLAGGRGLLFPDGEEGECAAAIARLMEDPALCARLGEEARSFTAGLALEAVLPQVMEACGVPLGEPAAAGGGRF